MMDYLERVDYQAGWKLWPDFGEKYPTGGIHSVRLTTYLNPPAYAAVIGREGVLPPNSIIVKENYTEEGEFTATTVMYKVDGYNPQGNRVLFAGRGLEAGTPHPKPLPGPPLSRG